MPKINKKVVEYYTFYCQGCKMQHTYTVNSDNSGWQFNGNIESPTFTPSLLNRQQIMNKETETLEDKTRCHLFITNGKLEYCGDCTHELAGKTVDLLDAV